ncbi:DoxX family protein [Lysobacter daejeonensis GH1-9]|uniref:DoxX family protein n=1 Tax=Lysobacter daejeonensis GH1-9 TaxID=1385517 RepID=A0A0A0ER62_9GAMM|nr:DoxX family protein [Lysobacter daejeonensis]KGM52643.1 DoxX family protein [Lysobacter daejeonensis GH1-9]
MSVVSEKILRSNGFWLAARILSSVVFVSSGLAKLLDFGGGVSEMAAAGLHPAWLFNIGTVIILLGGSALLLLDRAVWLGSLVLGFFLLLTIAVVHRFWSLPDSAGQQALYVALEHLSVVGGLMAATVASHFRKLNRHAEKDAA